MEVQIKDAVAHIYKTLEQAGYQAYLVGGGVRDLLIGRPVKDWDFATNATPEEIQKVFPDSFYDNAFGTVGIPVKLAETEHPGVIEVTTFRTESGYGDRRHPETVAWGTAIEEDLSRRDFTINAIASRILFTEHETSLDFIDPFGGIKDLHAKQIKAVRNPSERFQEDALRLMRAIRIATQLGFSIEETTWKALTENVHLIEHISKERTRDELVKILARDHPYEGILLLDKAGLLEIIIPELIKGKGLSQERPGRHHTSDVFTHNVLSLKHTPSTDPIVRFATLLHDVGKPYVAGSDENGLIIFYNHEVAGAEVASEIAERLRFSKKEREKIYTLIRWHMFSVDEQITDSAVRRFIRRVGLENVKDAIDLRIGDRLGSGTQTAESWRLKSFKERIEQQLNPPFSINDLVVDGYDVMKELDVKPGPIIGQVLNKLFEEVDEDLSKNTREYLLPRLKEVGSELLSPTQ